MATWYLDTDDEITDAVARLRGASDETVVFVVPPGSRIATGRINFKLLAREAESRDMRMAVASPDDQVRALATSAGVVAAATPDEAVAALRNGDVSDGEDEPVATLPASHPEEATATTAATSSPSSGGAFNWRSQRVRITTVLVLAIALVGLFTAWQTLPSAEVTLTPRTSAFGPLRISVVADPAVADPDVEGGRVPAAVLSIPLIIEETFSSSGMEITETHATGEVVFSSPEQLTDQDIAAGTRLQTPAGIEFRTTEAVTLGHSSGGPSEVTAPFEATLPGPEGNVLAGAVSIAPSLEGQTISVTNPEPTTGGRTDERPVVTSADYDDAAIDLSNRLAGGLVAYLRNPINTPEGLTLFTETAQLGPVVHEPDADEIVGKDTAEFTLSGTASARVLAVDEALIDELAHSRLTEAVPAAQALLEGSVVVEHGEGSAEGDRIHFEAIAEGAVHPLVDVDALREQIAGLPVSDAQAILEGIGTATVNVWPDFLGDLPGDGDRITLEVLEPTTTE